MAIHGSLRTMPLAEVLGWIKATHRSGTLVVDRDGGEWELLVKSGGVTEYNGPELRDNLGHIVVTSGLLTEEDLRVAYQYQRDHDVSLQTAMLACGLLTKEQIREAVSELATESIYDLFIDLPGEFVFSDEAEQGIDLELEDAERLPLDLDINHLLMEGARRQDEWQRIRERFPTDDVRIHIHDDKLPPLETLGVRQRRILASVSAGQSVTDICLELRSPVPSVLRALASLEEEGAISIEQIEGSSEPRRALSRADELVAQAQVLREQGQFDEAISLLEVAVRLRPDSEEQRALLREVLEEQLRALYQALPPHKVPIVVADEQRVRNLRLRPDERFLLDRLAAHMDIGSLVMVSSMSERDTLKTLRKLLHGGIIELQA